MEIATIVPTPYLHLTKDDMYFMALAHLVDEYREGGIEYITFFRGQAAKGKFILMDNGVVEKEQQTVEALIKRAGKIHATEVILPDTLYNGAETIMRSYRAIDPIKGAHLQIMAVPQGENLSEWENCATTMLHWDIDSIGITKFLTRRVGFNARHKAVELIADKVREKGIKIHLLGCWDSPTEILPIVQVCPDLIRGVDSAVAYVYAKGKANLRTDPRPDIHFDFNELEVTPSDLKVAIDIWKQICHGESNEL